MLSIRMKLMCWLGATFGTTHTQLSAIKTLCEKEKSRTKTNAFRIDIDSFRKILCYHVYYTQYWMRFVDVCSMLNVYKSYG